jgi:4'-phosphopantetheinyl transferase EntD
VTTQAHALSRLFPARVVVEETADFPDPRLLPAAELREVQGAVPQRQREFAAGRLCARRALAGLGIEQFALRVGPHREPLWPPGVVGSITHTDSYCAAAVGLAADIWSIGIDAEPAEPLDRDLISSICTEAEQRWLASQAASQRGLLARVLFSAKECWFKYQFPLTGRYVEFPELEIDLEIERGGFTARYVGQDPGVRGTVASVAAGRLILNPDLILTGVSEVTR